MHSADTRQMQIAARGAQVLFLIVLASSFFQFALAKPKRHRALVREIPLIDPSVLPKRSYFELRIKHTQIIFPPDPAIMLHGHNRVINLRGNQNDDLLRGRVTEEKHDSSISTQQYGVKPHFAVDLRKLTAKFAPELGWLMDAKVAAARRKAAFDIERQEKLMNEELHARQPQPDLPAMPVSGAAALDQANALKLAVARAKKQAQEDSQTAIREFKEALARANKPGAKMPPIPGLHAAVAQAEPQPVRDLRIPPSAKPDTSYSEQQMAAELARASLQGQAGSDVNARLRAAKKQAQAAVRDAQPVMDTILTSLRKVPPVANPAVPPGQPAQEADAQSVIQWDAWHARFAQLARGPILKSVSKSANTEGSDTVEITVWPDHRLAVRLTKPGNAVFDQAMLEAYRSLDGKAELEYPPGSRRASITFLIDHKHTGAGVPSSVKSQTSVGDQEILDSKR